MEDIDNLFELTEKFPRELEQMTEQFLVKLRTILYGNAVAAESIKVEDLPAPSPKQISKRSKRLSMLNEDDEIEEILVTDKVGNAATGGNGAKKFSPKKSKRLNAKLSSAESMEDTADVKVAPVAAPRNQFETNAIANKENEASGSQEASWNISGSTLMPPPPAPIASVDDAVNRRPQRAAKLKTEKNLKEPQLKGKLRRPTNEIKVKLEHEQRQSQMPNAAPESAKNSVLTQSKGKGAVGSLSSEISDDSVSIIPGKEPSMISINSDINEPSASTDFANNQHSAKNLNKSDGSVDGEARELCVRVKREKLSSENQNISAQKQSDDAVFKLPAPLPLAKVSSVEETSLTSGALSTTSNTTNTTASKKGRKKKYTHRPIKVERFSDLDIKPAPIASRTRNGSTSKHGIFETFPTKHNKAAVSVYEDAVEAPLNSNANVINMETEAEGVVNETVTLGPTADATMNLGPTPNDVTFCTNPAQATIQNAPSQTTFVMEPNPNATITLNKHSGSGPSADATFNIHQMSQTSKDKSDDMAGQRSFETAKDTSMPNGNNSLLTEEDEEQEKPTHAILKPSNTVNKAKQMAKLPTSSKTIYKMPAHTHELFNPLAQSPVKLRVEAFENAAAALSEESKRPLRSKKENTTPSAVKTPVIGKLAGPALGRFLTPTQSSNASYANGALHKKTTTSASKALSMTKSASASSLQRSNSTASTKTLQRENSADDFRKGLHSLAEERKKQREQKHLLAAQQREAKERERAERMAKQAKEREEKRKLKMQQETEQKKRELEEIQRKLRQQKEREEEAAKLKAAKEREMQLAKQKMMPPPPKPASKYTFEMLHEDDSTDDEDKVSYKRPPPPTWSRSHVRGPFMLMQEYTPSACIDSFFSVQPMTPDLKVIFPNIDARHLKRNSSVLWSTPPRYSELPKY